MSRFKQGTKKNCRICGYEWVSKLANPTQCARCASILWHRDARRPMPTKTAEALFGRFLSFVERDPETGCWIWQRHLTTTGYGGFSVGHHKVEYAHRWIYMRTKGSIPQGYEIDHLCHNRKCANPNHLEAVTHRENVMRGDGPTAVLHVSGYCIRGHAMTPENTRTFPSRPQGVTCLACSRLRAFNQYHTLSAAQRDKKNARNREYHRRLREHYANDPERTAPPKRCICMHSWEYGDAEITREESHPDCPIHGTSRVLHLEFRCGACDEPLEADVRADDAETLQQCRCGHWTDVSDKIQDAREAQK